MKNIFNKFAFFIALSFVFISCGNLTTSENDDSIPQGKGKITISTDLQNGRSVLPTAIDETTTWLKWELTGIKDGETTSNVIKYWTDGTDETGTVTAYQSMTSDSGIVIDTGTWDFTLTASNTDGKNVLSATISTTINAGENKLNFVMQEATENAASGSIEFTLNFPKEVVGNVVATLYKYDNDNNVVDTNRQLAINNSSNDFDSVKYSYPDATGTTSTDLSAGYYILKIELQQNVGVTTEDFKKINTYSCLIRVAPGLLSQGKYTLPDLAQLYTINYKLEGGYFTDSSTTTSYNAYTSFELPEPTYQGYYFAGWYTDSELTNPVELDENDKYRITQDTTLYAKWNKEVTGITYANNTLYISDYEGLCIFRDIVNGSHTDAITIPANESISGANSLDCNARTSYNYLSVELENDINVTDAWIPIGVYSSTPSESRDYNATFDGNNHTITLSNGIDSTSYAALFVNVKGTIKNLVVEGNIKSEGSNAVAGICAYSNGGTFEHCVNKCIINSNTYFGTGGIVGYSNGATIKSCVNMGEISSSLSTIGGIVGAAISSKTITIENSINLGKITGTSNVSGIFGLGGSSVSEQKITDCINIGEIAVTPSDDDYWTYAAGIICSSDSVIVSNCISVGNIINNTSAFAGIANFGAINYSSDKGTYSNCYYDSSKINNPNDSNAPEINSKTTSDLCNLDSSILSNWSKDASRYPLPNIVATDSSEGISELVWNEICELAKVDTSSSGSSGTATGITFAGDDSTYTTGSPKFYITTAEGLATFRDMVNGTIEGSITILKDGSSTSTSDYTVTSETVLSPIYGELKSDIELPSDENWIPIGSSENPFLGYFSGNNHTVSNLNINAETDNQGLFGVVEGTANNVWCTITKLVVEGNITSSACNVAGIAGKATLTKFENCVNKATVESISTASNVAVAGIAGYVTNVEMKYCYNAGSITASSGVAGIAGYETESNNFYEYECCINSGTITGGTNYSSIIGIANSSLYVYACANYGKIISTTDNETGCIIGTCMTTGSAKTYVYDILSVGTIKTQGTYHVITKTADIETSYYDNSVLSSEDVTGLFGYNTETLIDPDCPIEVYEDWYFTLGVYPIPNIEEYVSGAIWNEIVAAATPQSSGSNEPLVGTEVTSLSALQAAINGNDEVIIIASNITITECLNIERAVTIAANTDVTVIDYSYYDGYDNAFYVKDGGKLTLGGGSGVLTFKQNPSKNVASIATVSSNATIEININNNVKFTDNSYYWISMNAGNGACLNITGGEFSNNSKVPIYLNNASVNCHMSGGVISNNSNTETCAGIYVNKGNLTITGGDITNNTVTGNSSLSGSSIRVPSTSNGSVIVNGETLTANTTYTTNIIDGKPQE